MSSNPQNPMVLGAAIAVFDAAGLALVDVSGMPLGTQAYVTSLGQPPFFLEASSATLSATIVAVANVTGLRWIQRGIQPAGQTSFPSGTDGAPSVLVGPVADEVGLANVASQLRLCAAGVCGASISAGGQLNILGALAHLGATIGFNSVTPVAMQTGPGLAVTNSVTAGGVNGTIADFADLTTFANSAAAIRNDIFQLARLVKMISDALRAYGLLT